MKTVATKFVPLKWLGRWTRKRNVFLAVIPPDQTVNVCGTQWDGGSRNTYDVLTLRNGDPRPMQYEGDAPPRWPDRPTARCVLPRGCVLVKGGTFCGKPATLTVHVRGDDLAALVGFAGDTRGLVDPEILSDLIEETDDGKGRLLRGLFVKGFDPV